MQVDKMCTHEKSKCVDSRPNRSGRTRRYQCLRCGERWTTMEVRVENVKPGIHSFDAIRQKMGGLTVEQESAIARLIEVFLAPEKESPAEGTEHTGREGSMPG